MDVPVYTKRFVQYKCAARRQGTGMRNMADSAGGFVMPLVVSMNDHLH